MLKDIKNAGISLLMGMVLVLSLGAFSAVLEMLLTLNLFKAVVIIIGAYGFYYYKYQEGN